METRVMGSSLVAMLLVLLSVFSIRIHAQVAGKSDDDPIITINGTKNPELIPQWSVWQTALRWMAKDDSEELPTVVLRAITQEQTRALMQVAKAATEFDRDCNLRVYEREMAFWKAHPDLDTEAVNTRMTEGTMPCRRHTLDVRDKLLADVGPAGAAALSEFVEHIKKGWTTTMKKSRLKAYLLPE
jgi:hypothetical protein